MRYPPCEQPGPGEKLPPLNTNDQFPRFSDKFADIILIKISGKRARNCISYLLFCLFNLTMLPWSDDEPKAIRKIEKETPTMPFVRERFF